MHREQIHGLGNEARKPAPITGWSIVFHVGVFPLLSQWNGAEARELGLLAACEVEAGKTMSGNGPWFFRFRL